MIDSLSIDDKDGNAVQLHETATRMVTRVEGLNGPAQVRDVTRPLPNRHGVTDETKWMGERLITVEGEVWADTEAEAYTDFDAVTKPLLETLESGAALLKWQRSSGSTELQTSVKLADFEGPVIEGGPTAILRYQVSLRAASPFNFSQTLTTATGEGLTSAAGGVTFPVMWPATFTASGAGSASFTNSGSVPAPVTLRVYGQISSPQVLNVTTGDRLVLTGTVAVGDYLEIDTQARTVLLNGTTNRANLVDWSQSTWPQAPSGASTWRLLGSNFDATARLDVLGRSTYL